MARAGKALTRRREKLIHLAALGRQARGIRRRNAAQLANRFKSFRLKH
jgi:hypothetical protein